MGKLGRVSGLITWRRNVTPFWLEIYNIGKKDVNTFDSRGTIHIRGIRKFNSLLMIEGFLQKQYSASILLKDRNLAGGGFRR